LLEEEEKSDKNDKNNNNNNDDINFMQIESFMIDEHPENYSGNLEY
jgi:hypothetical protein